MANKKVFSYGNGGKRKIGHSKFDMGFEHIMSANFGGLHPAAVFETLPDDYWSISDNTVTLLKPMTAPAFTRINQNFYGAYVRNQQIWKYWNDYISNGTAFGDVYGNNVTNQSLQNAWDVPSIPTCYLQPIIKIGIGNATPLFRDVVRYKAGDSTSDRLAAFIVNNTTFEHITDEKVYRVTDLVYLLLQIDPLNSNVIDSDALVLAKRIDFTRYAFDVFMTKDSVGNYYFLFELYCSMRQFLVYRSCFDSVLNNIINRPSSIGGNVSDDYNVDPSLNPVLFLNYRFFADNVSPDPSTSKSAFLIEKTDYDGTSGYSLKSLDYYPRHIDFQFDLVSSDIRSSGISRVYQSISSPYWGFRYGTWQNSAYSWIESSHSFESGFDSQNDFWWHVDGSSLFGVNYPNDFDSLFESFVDNIHYLGVTTTDFSLSFDNFGGSAHTITFSPGTPSTAMSGFGSGRVTSVYSPFKVDCASDLVLPFSIVVDGPFAFEQFSVKSSVCTRDSRALGYDATSFLTYLCNNSSILLDSFGLKIDPLSQRSFFNYRFELTNALPFFAYSKIWNDNFRNSVVSSPELDYSESNSLIFADSFFYSGFVMTSQFIEPSVRPPRYAGKVPSDFDANGWTLEITTFPRNSQGSAIHTHLPVKSYTDVFRILTGHDFDGLFISLSATELNVFDYYSPSYYNGLLHLKYQNFNKDYFTSALLDPMSGANQVSVGSTINELRENEAKQHWWERTAMYRSIKNFFQGTYGITPIELPEDSRITGTDHIDVQIGEVIQTSGTTPESPQGTRSGLGGCRGSGTLCHGHANEHGWIIILLSHTIESQYLQAYDKMWDVKESFMDYPVIDFAGIGNESILQKELNYSTVPTEFYNSSWVQLNRSSNTSSVYYLPTVRSGSTSYRGQTNPLRKTSSTLGKFNISENAGTSLDNVFGFIPRYSSYKFKFDQVSGQFRHELNFWHTFKRYLTSPILCHEFVNWEMAADDDDINRIFAVSDDFLDDKFAIDCFINASVDRALPFVCVPMSK